MENCQIANLQSDDWVLHNFAAHDIATHDIATRSRDFSIKWQKSIWLHPYLIFVLNAVNAVRVKFLAECKKFQKNKKILFLAILL